MTRLQKILLMVVSVSIISGCAQLREKEERRRQRALMWARDASSFELCMGLLTNTGVAANWKSETTTALAERGENCSAFAEAAKTHLQATALQAQEAAIKAEQRQRSLDSLSNPMGTQRMTCSTHGNITNCY